MSTPSRRAVCACVVAGCLGLTGTAPAQAPAEPAHRLEIDVPLIADNPSAVPVTVSVDHPMEPDHYIERLELRLPTDPVPDKGTFLLTPMAGRASVSFQMRSGRGGELVAVAVCNRHGRFEARQTLEVAQSGCSGIPPATRAGEPRVWTTASAGARGVIPVWAKLLHSSHTGFVESAGRLVRQGEPFFVERVTVYRGSERVVELRLTAALSPDPQLRCFLRAEPGQTLRVVFEDNRGGRWEASRQL